MVNGKGAEVIYSIRDQPTWGLMIRLKWKTGQNIRNVYTRRNSLVMIIILLFVKLQMRKQLLWNMVCR